MQLLLFIDAVVLHFLCLLIQINFLICKLHFLQFLFYLFFFLSKSHRMILKVQFFLIHRVAAKSFTTFSILYQNLVIPFFKHIVH